MDKLKKPVLTNFVIGVLIAVAVVAVEWQYGHPLIHLLSDGFFVAAVLLIGFSGIAAAKNAGCFDMMGYSMRSLLGVVIPASRLGDPNDRESFLEYKERKSEKRKSPLPMLIAGAILLVLAVIMLIIYTLTT